MTTESLHQAYNEGMALFQKRKFAQAALKMQQFLQSFPQNLHARRIMADSLFSIANYQLAAQEYLECEKQQPEDIHCRYQLACSLMELRNFKDAALWFERVLESQPQNAKALCGYGVSLAGMGKLEQGLEALKNATGLDPQNHVIFFNYGFTLHRGGKPEMAKIAFEQALQIKPDCVDALYGLGNIYTDSGLMAKARELYRKAIEIEPRYYAPYSAIGFTWLSEHIHKAIDFYKQALSLNPNADDVLMRLGEAYQRIGEFGEANTCHRNAINQNPDNPAHYFSLSNLLIAQGKIKDALECCQKCLELQPDHNRAFSNLLMSLHYISDIQPQEIFRLHQEYDRHFKPDILPQREFSKNQPEKLNIGFVSGDFRRHSVSYFLIPLLENIDRSKFSITCYSCGKSRDDITQQIMDLCENWREICGVSEQSAAELIMADNIHILIDLSGHTADGRMPLFYQRPAPVSVSWLGYPDTTGLSVMDWRIVDDVTDVAVTEEDTQEMCSEKLLRFSRFLCYKPDDSSPGITPAPHATNNFITFGSFNNYAKVSDDCLKVWCEILRQVPDSRLLLKSRGLTDPYMESIVYERFKAHGIFPDRIDFCGYTQTHQQHLERYGQIDIALDTFPYNGTTTTFEALWMGVPVLTLTGQTHAARVGTSILQKTGLSEFIAKNQEEYVALACALAANPEKITQLREQMRDSLAKSPFMDGANFAAEFCQGLQHIWSEYISQPS